MKLIDWLAQQFAYTQVLEYRHAALASRLKEVTSERDAFKAGSAHERERAAAAEGRAEILKEELDRVVRWTNKLSDQNFDLTDRLCLKAHVPPTSEPLRTERGEDPDPKKVDELLDLSLRRTGPVANRRQKLGAAYLDAKQKAQTGDRTPPAHLKPPTAAVSEIASE